MPNQDIASGNSLTAYSDLMPNLLLFKPGIPTMSRFGAYCFDSKVADSIAANSITSGPRTKIKKTGG